MLFILPVSLYLCLWAPILCFGLRLRHVCCVCMRTHWSSNLTALPLDLRGEGGNITWDVPGMLALYTAALCELEEASSSVHYKKEKIPLFPK